MPSPLRSRFVYLVLTLIAFSAYAQTPCETPVISAPPQVCNYTPTVATILPPTEGSWQTAGWGITNGTFIDENGNWLQYPPSGTTARFAATGNGPVTLHAFAEHSSGCQVTVGTKTVEIRTIPAVELSAPAEVCPYTPHEVTMLPPAEGSWQMMGWGISSNGSFVDANGAPLYYPPSGTLTARFRTNNNDPVTIYAYARDSFGCEAPPGSVTVPIRTIPAAQINAPASVCSYAPATASIQPPAEGSWQMVGWGISHGTFVDANGQPIPSGYGESVRFTADASGEPVTLYVYAQHDSGCFAPSATIIIPVLAGTGGPPPSITVSSTDICGNQPITASIGNTYSSYSWSVVNGDIISGQGTNVLTFAANGMGPVTVSVTTDEATCPQSDSKTLQLMGYPIPIYAPTSTCPGALQKATVPYWYTSIAWTVLNATIEAGSGGETMYFRATGEGPVELIVQATDYMGCYAPNRVTIPLSGAATPEIWSGEYYGVCDGGTHNVQVIGDHWTNYQWSVTNGTVVNGQGGAWIQFTHTPGAPAPVVTVNVGEGSCTATASLPIALRPTVNIAFELGSPFVCANGTSTFYIDNYESFEHVGIYPTNGTITNIQPGRVPGGRTYTFRNNGAGPTRLQIYGNPVANECIPPVDVTVPMTAPAAPPVINAPPSICSTSTTEFAGIAPGTFQSANWTIANGTFTGGGTTATGMNVSFTASTTGIGVTLTARGIDANGCQTQPASVTVPFDNTAAPSLSAPAAACPGSSFAVTAAGDGLTGYSWSVVNGTLGIPPIYSTVAVYPDGNGPVTVNLTASTANGCARTASVTVPLAPQPSVDIQVFQVYDGPGNGAIASNENDVVEACGDPTIRLVPTVLNAANTYHWSTGASTAILDVRAPGIYTLTMTDANGCVATSSITVNYTAYPDKPVITTPATELCPAGGSITLSAPAASRWLWSNGATSQSIAVTEPGVYTVRVFNGLCESPVSDPVTITTGTSTVSVTGNPHLCANGSVTLTANGGTSWLWSNGATSQSIVVNAADSYTVTTSNGGCAMQPSAAVVVTASQLTATITSNRTAVCPGGAIQFDSSVGGGSGYSYQWYDQTDAPIPGAASPQLTHVPASSGFVYLKVTDAFGCIATSNAIQITVEATPVATITAPASICEGATGSVSVPDAGPNAIYSWSITNGTIAPNGRTATFSPSGVSAVQISVTVSNPGCSATSSATVPVNPLPAATITPVGSTAVCPGGSVRLNAPAGYALYSWSNGASADFIIVPYNNAGSYTVTVTSAAGCSRQSAPLTVTQNAATVITTQPLSQTMPKASTRTLSVGATGTGTLLYQWYEGPVGDTTKPKGNNATLQIGPYQKKGTYTYWVRVWSSTCPTSSVNSQPAVINVTN